MLAEPATPPTFLSPIKVTSFTLTLLTVRAEAKYPIAPPTLSPSPSTLSAITVALSTLQSFISTYPYPTSPPASFNFAFMLTFLTWQFSIISSLLFEVCSSNILPTNEPILS